MMDDDAGAVSRADQERRRVAAERALASRARGAVVLAACAEADAAFLKRVLGALPRRIELGERADEILRRIGRGGVDLVLVNLPGPEGLGWDILRRLKSDGDGRDVPAVAVTPAYDLEARLRAITLGADCVLSRPFHPEELAATVASRLEAKERLDRLRSDREAALAAARIDPQTGLWNARHFREFLDLEIKRSLRQKYPIGLIIIDLDAPGRAGAPKEPDDDGRLVALGRIVLGRIREVDLAARFEARSLVVVLPFADKATTETVARRILTAATRPPAGARDGAAPAAPLGLGLAVFPDDALNADDLVGRADRRLFKAGRGGKAKKNGDGDGVRA